MRSERRFERSTRVLAEIRDLVAGAAIDAGFSRREAEKIALAVDEAATNVIVHALGEEGPEEFDLLIDSDPRSIVVTLVDDGNAFSGTIPTAEDVTDRIRSGRSGGLGLFLIDAVMDDVDYGQDERGRNRLRMVKYRDEAQESEMNA